MLLLPSPFFFIIHKPQNYPEMFRPSALVSSLPASQILPLVTACSKMDETSEWQFKRILNRLNSFSMLSHFQLANDCLGLQCFGLMESA